MSGGYRSYLMIGAYMDLEKIKNDCLGFIKECGLELYSLTYEASEQGNILEFTVDKKGFVDIEDVEKVTEKINEYLDKTDPIDEEYSLSVTSRGVEKDFSFDDVSYYLKEWVEIKTIEQTFIGNITEATSDSITITNEKNKKIKINANDILSLKTIVKM